MGGRAAHPFRVRGGRIGALIELILQFLCEALLQVLAELALELGLEGVARALDRSRSHHPAVAFVGYLFLGAAVGGLSLWVLPRSFIGPHTWRSVNLLVTPLLAGLVMSAVGRLRARGRGAHTWLSTFMSGWGFAFGMTVVRYVWAKSWWP